MVTEAAAKADSFHVGFRLQHSPSLALCVPRRHGGSDLENPDISLPERMEANRYRWCIFLLVKLQRHWCVNLSLSTLFCDGESFLLVSQACSGLCPLLLPPSVPLPSAPPVSSTEACPLAFTPGPTGPSSDHQTVPLDLMLLSGHQPISFFSWSFLEKSPVHMIADPHPPFYSTNIPLNLP